MDLFELDLKFLNSDIKFLSRHINLLRGVNILNIAIAIYDGFEIYKSPIALPVVLIALGVIICNILWMTGEIIRIKSDLKDSKQQRNHMKNINRNEMLKNAMQQHKNAEELYKRLINSICHENKPQE